jgi:glycosyltransferase involved in cell wall biosynthesis
MLIFQRSLYFVKKYPDIFKLTGAIKELSLDVSVSICTYNRKESLIKCLESIFEQDYPKNRYEIVLVDDGSTDGTREAVESLKAPCHLKYVYKENEGIPPARNLGVLNSRGKYVLFVDSDIIACKELISSHMEIHEKYPESIAKGPIIHVDSFDNLDSKKNEIKLQDVCLAFFCTSNVSVEKRFIEEAGMFDETFREYGWEDLELGARFKKMKLKSRLTKKAIAFHYKKRWDKTKLPSMLKQARAKGRNAVLYLKKHPNYKVKMSTGIYFLRRFVNELMNMGGLGEKYCRDVVSRYPNEELRGYALLCARQLYTFEYFRAIRENIQNTEMRADA